MCGFDVVHVYCTASRTTIGTFRQPKTRWCILFWREGRHKPSRSFCENTVRPIVSPFTLAPASTKSIEYFKNLVTKTGQQDMKNMEKNNTE